MVVNEPRPIQKDKIISTRVVSAEFGHLSINQVLVNLYNYFKHLPIRKQHIWLYFTQVLDTLLCIIKIEGDLWC